jgi:hypothetical protein
MLVMLLLSPTGDSTSEAMLVVARFRCRVIQTTVLSSHASDDAAEMTWPRCDIGTGDNAVRVMMVMALPRHLGYDTM